MTSVREWIECKRLGIGVDEVMTVVMSGAEYLALFDLAEAAVLPLQQLPYTTCRICGFRLPHHSTSFNNGPCPVYALLKLVER